MEQNKGDGFNMQVLKSDRQLNDADNFQLGNVTGRAWVRWF